MIAIGSLDGIVTVAQPTAVSHGGETDVAALAAVLAVLLVAFRYTNGSASLGAVTLTPVLLGLSWILGVMYVLDIPFSFATATIGSIAIGLGVDYAIHMSERYRYELDRRDDVRTALEASVVGTGGALLGSAVTTAGGFGVLAFSLVPVMQQFGLVIAVAISFAFLASVLVLPSLLVVWTRSVHSPV
jgi:predicted RND superfamily exporter protein